MDLSQWVRFSKDFVTDFGKCTREVKIKKVSVKQLKNKAFNISDVAFLAGFSDLAVFSRNFKKWTGMTPSEFRIQHI